MKLSIFENVQIQKVTGRMKDCSQFQPPFTATSSIMLLRLTDIKYFNIFKHKCLETLSDVIRPVTRRGAGGGRSPPANFFDPLEKCDGNSLKLSDIAQKIWIPLRKLFAPPGVQRW